MNAATIATALAGLVGWHPASAENPAGPLHLPEALLESRSQLYVNDLNELLSLDVLAQIVPGTEKLETFLARLQKDALLRLVGRLALEKSLEQKVLVPNMLLVATPGRRGDVVNKQGRFVGIQMTLAALAGVAYTLPRLTLQLDAVQETELPIYVYSDGQPEPVKVVNMPANQNKANFPFEVDMGQLDISFGSQGNSCYVGYYEDDLTGYAIRRDFTGGPCNCAGDPYTTWGPYLIARPFSVSAAYVHEERELFDTRPEYLSYEYQNYGLNLALLSYCDVATALKSEGNQQRLAEAAQLAVGIRLLESIISSPRITQLTARDDVQADALALLYNYQARLYGGKEQGTDNYYPALLKSVKLDLSGLDAACKPSKRTGLSMGNLSR